MVGLTINGQHVRFLFKTSSRKVSERSGTYEPGERVEISARFRVPFAPGRYDVTPWVAHGTGERQLMDHREALVPVTVIGDRYDAGVVEIEHETSFEHLGTSVAKVAEVSRAATAPTPPASWR